MAQGHGASALSQLQLHSSPDPSPPQDCQILVGLSFSMLHSSLLILRSPLPGAVASSKPSAEKSSGYTWLFSTHPTPVAECNRKPVQAVSNPLTRQEAEARAQTPSDKGLYLRGPSAGSVHGSPAPVTLKSSSVTEARQEEGLLQSTASTWQSWGWNPGLQMFLEGPKPKLPPPMRSGSSERVSHSLGSHSIGVQPEPGPSQLTWPQGTSSS